MRAGVNGWQRASTSVWGAFRTISFGELHFGMHEHGALNRVLLISDEPRTRIESRNEVSPEVLRLAAGIVRPFVENCHEKLEEDHVFSEF
jgi:hypothetical protein